MERGKRRPPISPEVKAEIFQELQKIREEDLKPIKPPQEPDLKAYRAFLRRAQIADKRVPIRKR